MSFRYQLRLSASNW